jgi:enoyl-CoA hydratase
MSWEYMKLELDGNVAIVTMNRAPVNALSYQLRDELESVFDNLEHEQDVWVVILRGTERLFSVGVDIKQLSKAPPHDAIPRNQRYQRVYDKIEQFRAPVIAAINGYALGGGLELAMACDIRVAEEDAEVGLPEIILGGIPGIGGPQRLSRLVGVGKAKQLILSGDRIKATEAHRIGLIDELAPTGKVMDVALPLAKRIASRPPLSVQAAKQAIHAGRDLPLERALELDLRYVGQVAGTADRMESLQAFLEKRPPNVTGR